MRNINTYRGFTLIEVIVSLTIFGIIMVSVISIFIFSSQMSQRVELNRVMQENIKTVVEDIAEEVRKGHIIDVSPDTHDCGINFIGVKIGTKLCLEGGINYTVGYYDTSIIPHKWLRVTNMADCSDTSEDDESICRVIKQDSATGEYFPLSNSFVAFESLNFIVTNEVLPKVTIHMILRPAYRKGIHSEVIQTNILNIQTTISERLIETD